MIIYIFAFVGFYFFDEYFMDDTIGPFCTNLFYCFIYIINFGLRSGGGIAEVIKRID